jgi:hypothetical protein
MFTAWKIKRIVKKIKFLQQNRMHNQPTDQQLKQEIDLYHQLVILHLKLLRKKKHPFASVMVIESYKGAANLNDPFAHFQLAQMFLEEAKYRHALEQDGVFNSENNQRRTSVLFEESHAHLLAAEGLGHAGSKRLRGLCIINGWGVPADKNVGFELVVSSIEQEGSWDKVPQIFASMGLNKPEFFSAIMQRRKGGI